MNNLFTQRIKLLRKSHNLSMGQTSFIFKKSRATFSELETGKRFIGPDFLMEYTDFFAVSIDWLLGRSDEPYSLPVIELQEKKMLELEKNINQKENNDLIYIKLLIKLYTLKEVYWPNRDSYSLDQRAEVIFALNFLIYTCKRLDANNFNLDKIKDFCDFIKLKELTAAKVENNKLLTEKAIMLKKEKLVIKDMIEILSSSCSSVRARTTFSKLCWGCVMILNDLYYYKIISNNLRKLTQKQN